MKKIVILLAAVFASSFSWGNMIIFDGLIPPGSSGYPAEASQASVVKRGLFISLPPSSWAGYTLKTGPYDLKSARDKGSLEFYIKGTTGKEDNIMISLTGPEGSSKPFHTDLPLFYYCDISTKWKKVSIPLKDFSSSGYFWDVNKNDRVNGAIRWENISAMSFDVIPSEAVSDTKFYVKNVVISEKGGSTKVAGRYDKYEKFFSARAAGAGVKPALNFKWPKKYRAAVTITFDDGLMSQADKALPILQKYGLTGTFFLGGYSWYSPQNLKKWKKIKLAGNEIGSHTKHHPCDAKNGYQAVGYTLEDYSIGRLAQELDSQKKLFASLHLAKPEEITFAYPCGNSTVGKDGKSYVPVIRKYFSAARGIDETVADPKSVDLYQVPCFDGSRKTGKELIELVKRAEKTSGWTLLYFHGIDGDFLSIDSKAFEELLNYLKSNNEEIWTGNFRDISEYIGKCRTKQEKL